MLKRLITALAAVLISASLFAQSYSGGVKGTVVNRATKSPVEMAKLTLYQGTQEIVSGKSDENGQFLFENLDNGVYLLVIEASDYITTRVNVTVNDGYIKNMFNISLTSASAGREVDAANFTEFDMDDSGYSDNPSVLFSTNDIYNNITNFAFSSIRFRNRGYTSESQDVYLAGVRMNDAITGYGPFSLWSGLNEATRSKESATGLESSDYGFGSYNGLTNIFGDALSMRTGWRFSALSNSAFYRLRLMGSYASGQLDNGWSYAFNFSTRLGGNDCIKGVYYRSFSYYGGVSKTFNPYHKLSFAVMAAPGQRGAQNTSTQEVYDLMHDNMYNSNWGFQNGKIRNSRVRKTHEPITFLKYDFKTDFDLEGFVTLLYRFGKNGYTALDWYDAPDPRPDYYRNLPSYFFMENSDYNRKNFAKYAWAREAWETMQEPTITHINWDRLYNVNKTNITEFGARSKYVQEERRVDQRDLNFATAIKWKPLSWMKLNAGFNAKLNRTRNFKVLADLLGGDYYLDIDQFAERDFSSSVAKTQNDLDYFLANGSPRMLKVGDEYGYNYLAQIRTAQLWFNDEMSFGDLAVNFGAKLGYTTFWREGLVRKGLFAGLDPNGNQISYNGEVLTTYDPSTGEAISSFGKSKRPQFLTGAAKLGLNYVIGGKMRVYANAGFYSDAPTFSQAFISPRTRNNIISNLENSKVATVDLNYQYSFNNVDLRVTAYYTKMWDMTDVMSFYDDLQNSFTNFAMNGIGTNHKGIELGFRVPAFLDNLFLKGAVSYSYNVYDTTPRMTQTVDNSSDVIMKDQLVPYWTKSPVYNRDADGKIVASDLNDVKKWVDHHVPSSPEFASLLGLSWNKNYWFVDLDMNYFANSYLDMNPLYRTDVAAAGPDGDITPEELEYMTAQEKFKPAFLVNFSLGKSWYIQRKYQVGLNLQVNNLLNNTNVRTGGYEQTRLVDNTVSKERFYRFDPKYFYMPGTNYMLNIYVRF